MSKEQKLIDIMFEMIILVQTSSALQEMTQEELAEWARKQLDGCGFSTEPIGASWAVLK